MDANLWTDTLRAGDAAAKIDQLPAGAGVFTLWVNDCRAEPVLAIDVADDKSLYRQTCDDMPGSTATLNQ